MFTHISEILPKVLSEIEETIITSDKDNRGQIPDEPRDLPDDPKERIYNV